MYRLSTRCSPKLLTAQFLRYATKQGSKKGELDELSTLVSFCKRRGFISSSPGPLYPAGLSGTFDYGPLGAQLKKNLRDAWWTDFITTRKDCVGIETPIIINPEVWKAAGHIDNFVDPIVECNVCGKRLRADKLLEETAQITVSDFQKITEIFSTNPPPCGCSKNQKSFSAPRLFNLLFETQFGPTSDTSSRVYLRPETAQAIFTNFPQIVTTTRKRLPLGIGQIGKSFRNEISPRDFIFRSREFEQMELEYFCHPNEAAEWFNYWVQFCRDWLIRRVGIREENIRLHNYDKTELAHYAAQTTDIEYRYAFGWSEMWGIANRSDYDLKAHSNHTKIDAKYTDDRTKESYIPYVVEPALGLDRLVLAVLSDAYVVETVSSSSKGSDAATESELRTVLRLKRELSPFQFAVMPLMKKEELMPIAERIYDGLLAQEIRTDFDVSGAIGRRYRRQDEIGTPYCVTVDYETLQDNTVTVRERDSMDQVRVNLDLLLDSNGSMKKLFARLDEHFNVQK